MLIALSFVLGLLLGSFLNVCIDRLPQGESIVGPRSHCPHCKRTIHWYDNIPLLSYLLLRTRCRFCKVRIPFFYPLVELTYAFWLVLCAQIAYGNRYGYLDNDVLSADHPLLGIKLAVFGFLLLGLAVMDWRDQILPDAFTFPGMLLGFLFICVQALFLGPNEDNIVLQHQINIRSAAAGNSLGNVFMTGPEHLIFGRLLAILCAFLLLFCIRALYKKLRGRDGMGLGDAKLLAMIAAFLGFAQSLLALFIGVLLATAYSAGLLLRRRADGSTRLAFGTFLCVGGFVGAIFGSILVDWYTSLLQ